MKNIDNLFNRAIELYQQGRVLEARAACESILASRPGDAAALNLLGVTHLQTGDNLRALGFIERAIALKPDFPDACNNMGVILKRLGRFDEASACYRKVLALKPDDVAAHYNCGLALKELGRHEEAAACYRRALAINPAYVQAHNTLGNALTALKRYDEAFASYRQALALKPDYVDVYLNFGNALQELSRFEDAIACYRQALLLRPGYADAHNSLGNTLMEQDRPDEAIGHYRDALRIRPDYAEAHFNLGLALRGLGRLDEAGEHYLRALALKPKYPKAYSNLLYMHASTRHISPLAERALAANWENSMLDEHERAAARKRSFAPREGRQLRLGIVSAELGRHPVADFLGPLLAELDRARFHVSLFPTALRPEPEAERFRTLADAYTPLVGLSDAEAAAQIRAARIDVLIDTTGHMKDSRMGIFAHRAAPVQCHYIGYHGSTGLSEMDWFIADDTLLPAAYDAHFCEPIWRLPRLRLAYGGDASLPESNWRPAPDGAVWLGSFTNLAKVRDEALALWARVMHAVPESKLLLKHSQRYDELIQARIRDALREQGIGGERVEFAARTPDWRAHMALYDRLDIALDTLPLNSETTAFDALWMGVPVVAMEGDWYGARMTGALLKALGKPEWVAKNAQDFVVMAAALARNRAGRAALRKNQRALMAGSALCDVQGLARALENAFEKMAGRRPENARADLLAPE